MSGSPDESFVGFLSLEDWQRLQIALSKFRIHGPSVIGQQAASRREVMTVLENAGAADPGILWGALTEHFRVLKFTAS